MAKIQLNGKKIKVSKDINIEDLIKKYRLETSNTIIYGDYALKN